MTSQADRSAWFKRTDYDRSDSVTRTQLLEAAERVFADVGYAKASIARIADDAGVARATFYVYFTSRQEVFKVLTEDIIANAQRAQRSPGVDGSDPQAVIRASIRTMLNLYTTKSPLLTIIEQQSKLDPEVNSLWESFWNSQIHNSTRFIERLQREGRADPQIDQSLASESMTAILLHHGLRNAEASDDLLDDLTTRLSPVYERLIGLREKTDAVS